MKFDKKLFESVELQCQMYESPIKRIYDDIRTQIIVDEETQTYKAIQNVGISVDKEELIKALNYDRNQYGKGYKQGRADERKKIIEILDEADDIANAMYLLGRYIISEELKEEKE